jgi:hypothetical protein
MASDHKGHVEAAWWGSWDGVRVVGWDENGTEIFCTELHRIFRQIRIRFKIRNTKFEIGTKMVRHFSDHFLLFTFNSEYSEFKI